MKQILKQISIEVSRKTTNQMNFAVLEECFQAMAKLGDQTIDLQVLKNDNIPSKTHKFFEGIKE